MNTVKIAKLCNEIEDIACDISQQTMNDIISAESRMIFDKVKEIAAEITAQPKSNDEHTAAYWMQKTMDTAHEAYDRLKDTVDFRNAIAEVEAIKQRMGITEQKKQTNADRIRRMTDEELRRFLNEIADNCSMQDCKDCPMNGACDDVPISMQKWLKQEVSEDVTD